MEGSRNFGKIKTINAFAMEVASHNYSKTGLCSCE